MNLERLERRIKSLEAALANLPLTTASGGATGSELKPRYSGNYIPSLFFRPPYYIGGPAKARRREIAAGEWNLWYGGYQTSNSTFSQQLDEAFSSWECAFSAGGKVLKTGTNVWNEFMGNNLLIRFEKIDEVTELPITSPQIELRKPYWIRNLDGNEFDIQGTTGPIITLSEDAVCRFRLYAKPTVHWGWVGSGLKREELDVQSPVAVMKTTIGQRLIHNPFSYVAGRGAKFVMIQQENETLLRVSADSDVGHCDGGEVP